MVLPAPKGINYPLQRLAPQPATFRFSFPFTTHYAQVGDQFVLTLTPIPATPPAKPPTSPRRHHPVQTASVNNDHPGSENRPPRAEKAVEGVLTNGTEEGRDMDAKTSDLQEQEKVPPPPPPQFHRELGLIALANIKAMERVPLVLPNYKNCYFCGQRSQSFSHLSTHMAVHTGEAPFPCVICGYCFKRKWDLTKHHRLHNERTRRPFQCSRCEKSFTQKSYVLVHFKNVHLGWKKFPCTKCPMKFGEKRTLTRHMDSVHLGIRHKCHKCKCTYSNKSTLQQHLKKKHDIAPKKRILLLPAPSQP